MRIGECCKMMYSSRAKLFNLHPLTCHTLIWDLTPKIEFLPQVIKLNAVKYQRDPNVPIPVSIYLLLRLAKAFWALQLSSSRRLIAAVLTIWTIYVLWAAWEYVKKSVSIRTPSDYCNRDVMSEQERNWLNDRDYLYVEGYLFGVTQDKSKW